MVASLLQAIRAFVAEVRPAASTTSVRLDSRLDTDLGMGSITVAKLLVRVQELFEVGLPLRQKPEGGSPANYSRHKM
jgi:acyl carrier protein